MLSLSFVLVTGFRSLLGAGPAIFLTASALAALPAGRAMDRFGRVPVIVVGFLLGSIGYSLAAVGTHWGSGAALITGFAFAGIAGAVTLLIRTAAGDMYPPERRARGISLRPLRLGLRRGPRPLALRAAVRRQGRRRRHADASRGSRPPACRWSRCGLALTVRPDTKVIAERIAARRPTPPTTEPRRFERSCAGPGVIPALLAAIASFGVMVSVMNLTGFVVVDHHHHSQQAVFPIIGAHVLGMYALVLVIGDADRQDRARSRARRRSLRDGGVVCRADLGDERADDRASPLRPRHRLEPLVRRGDRAARRRGLAGRARKAPRLQRSALGLTGAALALLGGVALDVLGVTALALGATAIAVAPAMFLARIRPAPEPAA